MRRRTHSYASIALRAGALILLVALACSLAACSAATAPANDGRLSVVAAENVWGSIATEIGGERATVRNIISNRNTDPHEYEPAVADARAIADASVLVLNGAGYDRWVGQLAAASPDPDRIVVDVGALAGVEDGANPHLWYDPSVVHVVAERLADEFARLDPAGRDYYAARLRRFREVELRRYDELVTRIASRHAGTRIGASESIVIPLASALKLDVITPEAFVDAVSEGMDPTASSKTVADEQIRSRRIAVFVYNDQNATPDVTALVRAARQRGIPVVTVSETIPAHQTFGAWQTAQLESLLSALEEAPKR